MQVVVLTLEKTPGELLKSTGIGELAKIEFKPIQLEKTPNPIELTEEGILIVVNLVQASNARLSIKITEEGIVMDDNLLQLLNADSPIYSTEEGTE